MVALYNPATQQFVQHHPGHLAAIHSLAWNPMKERLASAGSDGTVKVWSLPSGTDSSLPARSLTGWAAESLTGFNHSVLYVHTKYMLVDPLGATPVVVYLGEFMRLFSHYALRESLRFKDNTTPAAALRRKHLAETAA